MAESTLVSLRIPAARESMHLSVVHGKVSQLKAASYVLVACIRNEMARLPHFLDYYRKLGIQQFALIDNDSTDGLLEYVRQQPDCVVWHTKASYKNSNFGMHWCNFILNSYCVGKWCLTCDPDELLVYPFIESRTLPELCVYLDDSDQPSLFTIMIDAYSDLPIRDTMLTPGTDPFEICPYFDRFNLSQKVDESRENFWVQGGCRMRQLFRDRPYSAPALNKVPLIKWRKGLYYVSSMHHTSDKRVNCPVYKNPSAVSGILFHFKYVSLLQQKAAEEQQRKQHYGDSVEYNRYAKAGDTCFYSPDISIRYEGPQTLIDQGFMQQGAWY